MQESHSAAKDGIVEGVGDDVTPSGWNSIACSFWNVFDHPEREIKPVSSSDAQSFPEVDYDKYPTNLYKQIEAKNWTAVNQFLLTGYWSGSFFADSTPPREQTCTWITKYEPVPGTRKKHMVWTHLPIHAALTHGAPDGTIQLLVKMAPPTLRCADDFRMLPLHLAFRRGSSDSTIAMIMNGFPEGVAVRDQIGRTPTECATESPNKDRGVIIQTVLAYNQRAWEKKAAKAQEEQMQTVKKTLQARNDRISHLKTAIDLIRSRENQTLESWHLVMAELREFKEWYDHKEENLSSEEEELRVEVVKELSAKLKSLSSTAESLRKKQKKTQRDCDKTLKDLNAAWGEDIGMEAIKFRNFTELMRLHKTATEDLSTADSVNKEASAKDEKVSVKKEEPKAEPKKDEPKAEVKKDESPAKVEKAEPPAEKVEPPAETEKAEPKIEAEKPKRAEKPKEAEAEKPKEAEKAKDGKKAKEATKEVVKEEPKVVAEDASVDKNKDVPHVVSASLESEEQDEGINRVISDMTSLDGMSESGASSIAAKMKKLKKGIKKSLSKKSLSSKSKKSGSDAPLPPKDASSKSKKSVTDAQDPTLIKCPADKRSSKKSAKVTPVTHLQLDGPGTPTI